MPEFKPGMFVRLVTELQADANAKCKLALTQVANVIEKQAKINASSGAHKYGTKKPAHPGTGPAIISGNLRRSITHTPVALVGPEWQTKVGTAIGFYPTYGGSRRTPANKYGYYLETGLRNGAKYPFLMPAFKFGYGVPADLIYQSIFGSKWRKIL